MAVLTEETGNPNFALTWHELFQPKLKMRRTLFAQKSDLNKKRRFVFVLVVLRLTRKAIGQCEPFAVAKPLARSLFGSSQGAFLPLSKSFSRRCAFQQNVQPHSSPAPEPRFVRSLRQDSPPLSRFRYWFLARKSSRTFCKESFGSNCGV